MTVEGNVAFGLPATPERAKAARVAEILQMFHVEPSTEAKAPGNLRRRKAAGGTGTLAGDPAACAVAGRAAYRLDAELKGSIIDDLRAWNAAHQIPILYVTHSREEVDAIGERMIAHRARENRE